MSATETRTPALRTYVDRLADNPDWQMLSEEIESECARLIETLVMLAPGSTDRVEALRGEIRGLFRLIEAPGVARRVIKERRER